MLSSETKLSSKSSCYHCGDECLNKNIHKDDKYFCCLGCKTVFEILDDNNLAEYYNIESNPGNKQEVEHIFSDFGFLDIEEVKNQLITFSDGAKTEISFSIPGIHCSSCIWLLERLPKMHEGVFRVEVNFLKKHVDILIDEKKISLRKLAELLESLGYRPNILLEEKEKKKADRNKDLSYIYKLGISGFAFGNIMLLSLPEYFEEGMYLDEQFGPFFGYINLILGFPVFFYCSSQYFVSAWKGIKHKALNIDVPISLGILVLFVRSVFEIVSQTGPGYIDSMTGLVFFLLVGRWFQNRTYQALSFEKDYKNYFPLGVTKMIAGKTENILLKDVKEGDQLLIRNGELLPADAQLIKGRAFIDYSFVTGESEPISPEKGSKLYAGGRQRGEQIIIEIIKEFSQSYLMQLWKHEDKNAKSDQQMSAMINRVSQYFTSIVLLTAALAGLYWSIVDASKMMHAVSSVLIIACPCALALCIPFTYGNGLKLLEKVGIYLKDARFIERMAHVSTVVFDKTGTITSQKSKDLIFYGKELSEEQKVCIKSMVIHSTHPLSRGISEHFSNTSTVEISDFEELLGEGLNGKINGIIIKMGSADFLGIPTIKQTSVVHVNIGGQYLGYFKMGNIYRNGLKNLITNLKKENKIEVMTGDTDAEEINLKEYFGDNVWMKFAMSPMDKRNHIETLQRNKEKVLMLGDGLNDAGAISESYVGISISDDIFGFLPSCDAILEADSLSRLGNILKFTGASVKLVKVNFTISFAYNLVGMYFAVQGILSPIIAAILMPLSSITVVSFAILSTNIMAHKYNFYSFDNS